MSHFFTPQYALALELNSNLEREEIKERWPPIPTNRPIDLARFAGWEFKEKDLSHVNPWSDFFI